MKEPQGNVVHADRYTLTDDFRDGFVQSLSVVSRDNSHITADRAIRRNGNVNEFENGKFTPCKSDGGTPPLVVHQRRRASFTTQKPQRSPIRTPTSRFTGSRSSSCPTSRLPIRP